MTVLKVVYDWLKAHPNVRCALVAVVVFALGYGTAMFAGPAKIVEKIKIKTVTKTEIQYKDRIVTQKVYVEQEKKRTHETTTTTKKPDGTVVTQTTKDENVDENQTNNTTVDAQHQQIVTQVVTQIVYKDKMVLKQPDWRVYAGVGYSFAGLAGQSEIGLPSMHGLVVQAGADRRVLGPIFLGVSLNTQGTAFVNVSGAF